MKRRLLTRSELKQRILEVIAGRKLACLATLAGKKPWVRLVMCHSEGFNIYICTFRNSRKVSQVIKDPDVHLAISRDINDFGAPYLQIAGRAKVRHDKKIRYKLWVDFMKKYYSGPDDPAYVVIEVKPELIEYQNTELGETQVYTKKGIYVTG